MWLFFIGIMFTYTIYGMDAFEEHIKKVIEIAKRDQGFMRELTEDFFVSKKEYSQSLGSYKNKLEAKLELEEKIKKQKISKKIDEWHQRASLFLLILGYIVISLQKADL